MCESCISSRVTPRGVEEQKLSCRLCFKILGWPHYRSKEDPTVCVTCYRIGTDLQTHTREVQAAQQSDVFYGGNPVAAPEDEVEVTPQGGKHTRINRAFHHLDPELMLSLARVWYTGGQKYGRNNWKQISTEDHLNHALAHVYEFMADPEDTDALEHAISRLMMAWSVNNEGGPYGAAH